MPSQDRCANVIASGTLLALPLSMGTQIAKPTSFALGSLAKSERWIFETP